MNVPAILDPLNRAMNGGSDDVTDSRTSRAARRYASFATRHRTADGSDDGRYERSAGATSHAVDPTADDRAPDASNCATGHPQESNWSAAGAADMAICCDEALASAPRQAASDVSFTASGIADWTSETPAMSPCGARPLA